MLSSKPLADTELRFDMRAVASVLAETGAIYEISIVETITSFSSFSNSYFLSEIKISLVLEEESSIAAKASSMSWL